MYKSEMFQNFAILFGIFGLLIIGFTLLLGLVRIPAIIEMNASLNISVYLFEGFFGILFLLICVICLIVSHYSSNTQTRLKKK